MYISICSEFNLGGGRRELERGSGGMKGRRRELPHKVHCHRFDLGIFPHLRAGTLEISNFSNKSHSKGKMGRKSD